MNQLKLQYCLIGAEEVGKSSFIQRLDKNNFKENYEPTIGADYHVHVATYDEKNIKYNLWDISGQDKFDQIANQYSINSNGLIAFYDITNKESFHKLKLKINNIREFLKENSSIIVIGNKSDLEEQRQVAYYELESYANLNGYLFIEISVKNGLNVQEALKKITDETIRKIELTQNDLNTSRSFNITLNRPSSSALNSARLQRIDAMSNSLLISSVNVYNRQNEIETRKFIADLIDQVKLLKIDNEKKDKLILDLSSFRETNHIHEDSSQIKTIINLERKTFENIKNEIELKYDTLSAQFAEEKAKSLLKDDKINELKNEITSLKSEISNLSSLNDSKSIRITELQNDITSYESVSAKSSMTINALQADNKELQTKILDLESHIRVVQVEKEEMERQVKIYSEKIRNISSRFSFEFVNVENIDQFVLKIEEIKNESYTYKHKFNEINEKFLWIQSENSTSKQTILNLKTEISNYEKEILELKISLEKIKIEKEAALQSREILEREIQQLKEKLIDAQSVWLSTTKQLDSREETLSTNQVKIKNLEIENSNYKAKFDLFKEEISKLLSDDYVKIEPIENDIKEKIKLLMLSSKHRGLMVSNLDGKIKDLSYIVQVETDEKIDLKFQVESSLKKINILEDKILDLENKYSDSKTKVELLTSEKLKLTSLLDRTFAKFDISFNTLINSESSFELILSKIESLKQTKTSSSCLETKLKHYKEQLENRDVHLNLLRKKLTELEEEKFGKSEFRIEFDNLVKTKKKQTIKIEKLTEELIDLKKENTLLKSQILDVNNLKLDLINRESEISKLKLRISELETSSDHQTIRIGDLRDDIDSANSELNKTLISSQTTIKALSSELRALKIEYEKTRNREIQLLDFRNTVARKLGLNVSSLTLADYEIISRIECCLN